MSERIYTRCPACEHDCLTIKNGHLLCTWHECPDPCAIEHSQKLAASMRKLLQVIRTYTLAGVPEINTVDDVIRGMRNVADKLRSVVLEERIKELEQTIIELNEKLST